MIAKKNQIHWPELFITLVAAVIVLVVIPAPIPTAGCNTPEGKTATNLIQPAFACGEAVLLTEIGIEDPAAIAAECTKFGVIGFTDVVTIAKQLLNQLFPTSDASVMAAENPLKIHLQKVVSH